VVLERWQMVPPSPDYRSDVLNWCGRSCVRDFPHFIALAAASSERMIA
jgi:hypothetical protein